MKIGILTASRTNNIGTDLQALAMQWLFSSYGTNTVELINYKCIQLEKSRKVFNGKNLHDILTIPYNLSRKYNHTNFRKKYISYSKHVYDVTNIHKIDYDLVVVGSDQIWNLNITGNDISFFLPFQFAGKKTSYAVSVSEKNIYNLLENHNLNALLNDFSGVSVREQKSAELLTAHGIPAKFHLDPLLMIDTTKWNTISSMDKPKKDYVLLYVVDRVQEAITFAKQYAKEYHLDVYLWGNMIRPVSGVKVVRFKGLDDWINYIKNATLIVTNSYHGLSFAINYNKNFAIFNLKNSDSNSRIDNLLDIIGLENGGDAHIYTPNWSLVEKHLNIIRKSSKKYISNMLEEVENYV